METEWQRRERKTEKEEMLRLCRLLDVKTGTKRANCTKVRSIIHKEEKVKNKDTRRTENEKRKVQKKRKIKS